MIKAIIVDDEAKSRTTLNDLLKEHCTSITVADMVDSIENALIAIAKHKPQLIFLDIEMPFENGFALFEKIKDPDFDVVFITAYDHYATRAIKVSALDYLLKPINVDELIETVEKIEKKQAASIKFQPDFELLLSNLKLKGNSAKISVPVFDGLQMVDSKEIVKCTADESYTHIKLTDGNILLVSRILKEYEELLSDFNFFRVHNSCLINLAHVSKYIKGDGGYVLMSDGETVEVSRRKKAELLNRLSLIKQ